MPLVSSPPEFISGQVHKGIGGSGTFIGYAVWESSAKIKRPVITLTFRLVSKYPARTVISVHILSFII